jgi:hypothetical protein
MWRTLDTQLFWVPAELVAIENQPALRNPTMKSIAETLHSFFMCRGIIDKEITGSSIERVKFVSPMACDLFALLGDSGKRPPQPKDDSLKARYRTAKKESVTQVRAILDPKWRAFLESHRKKDDLCDSLLLALREIQRAKACASASPAS